MSKTTRKLGKPTFIGHSRPEASEYALRHIRDINDPHLIRKRNRERVAAHLKEMAKQSISELGSGMEDL